MDRALFFPSLRIDNRSPVLMLRQDKAYFHPLCTPSPMSKQVTTHLQSYLVRPDLGQVEGVPAEFLRLLVRHHLMDEGNGGGDEL